MSEEKAEINFTLPILLPTVSYVAIILITALGWNFANRFLTSDGRGLQLVVDAADPEEHEIETNVAESNNRRHYDEKPALSNNRYFWILCLLAIFYSLPVFQFVIRYLEKDESSCCFNDDCMKAYWGFKDFGGLFSNIGYILLGFAFLAFVRLRQRSCNQITAIHIGVTHGSHLNFGAFYALGSALIAEGLFSGGYHICPNKQNFQFDTSFMYAMALLGYAVIYQMRHKKKSVYEEVIVYMGLAVLVFSTAIGLVVTDSLVFGIIFTIVYIAGLIAFHQWFIHLNKEALIWTAVVNLFLLALFWWTWYEEKNIGTRILYIALGNLIIGRITYYLFMKFRYRESEKCTHQCWQPMIYLALSLIFWISGITYFNLSPHLWDEKEFGVCLKSSTQNCYVSIYDVHDIWHFLSALGLFYSFMMLLTIDDHIMGKSRRSIEVF